MRRRPGKLELDAEPFGREFQLPEPRALLDAVSERYPVTSESEVLRVVVRRDERSGLDGLAKVRKPEVLAGNQLQLTFDGFPHNVSA